MNNTLFFIASRASGAILIIAGLGIESWSKEYWFMLFGLVLFASSIKGMPDES